MRNPRARVVDEMREGGGFELSSERKGGRCVALPTQATQEGVSCYVLICAMECKI